jgi:hypothetical protein
LLAFVEHCAACDEEFAFKGNELIYALSDDWWRTLEEILPVYTVCGLAFNED